MPNRAFDFLRRYAPAFLLAGAIVAAAPVMGQLRDFFFRTFPGRSLKLISIFLAVVAATLS